VTTFVALYAGPTVSTAELVALSSDRRLVSDVTRQMVLERTPELETMVRDPHHNTATKEDEESPACRARLDGSRERILNSDRRI